MSDNPLIIEELSRSFGAVEALRDINLTVSHHELIAVVGPSGCGKTTLLNLLSGHDTPSVGHVVRSGRTRTVYQRDGLLPWLTAKENILLGLRGIRDAEAIRRELADLFSLIGLERFANHYPHELSGGMCQRVELARALAGESDILLMDEPFSSLDYLTRLRLRSELVRMLHERPRTVVLVTHDIEEAAQLADRLVVLSDAPGRIREILSIEVPRPRNLTHPAVVRVMHRVFLMMGLEDESVNGKHRTCRIPAAMGEYQPCPDP